MLVQFQSPPTFLLKSSQGLVVSLVAHMEVVYFHPMDCLHMSRLAHSKRMEVHPEGLIFEAPPLVASEPVDFKEDRKIQKKGGLLLPLFFYFVTFNL